MADEALITMGLFIRKIDEATGRITMNYQGLPIQYRADINGVAGPTPGDILIPTTGVAINFSNLNTMGLCRLTNKDPVNTVYYGVQDGDTGNIFLPFKMKPGESFIVRLSENLQWEYIGTGTGTVSAPAKLFMRAGGDDCRVLVEAFDD